MLVLTSLCSPYARFEIEQHRARNEVAVIGLRSAPSPALLGPHASGRQQQRTSLYVRAHTAPPRTCLVKERVLAVEAVDGVLAERAIALNAVLQAQLLPERGSHYRADRAAHGDHERPTALSNEHLQW